MQLLYGIKGQSANHTGQHGSPFHCLDCWFYILTASLLGPRTWESSSLDTRASGPYRLQQLQHLWHNTRPAITTFPQSQMAKSAGNLVSSHLCSEDCRKVHHLMLLFNFSLESMPQDPPGMWVPMAHSIPVACIASSPFNIVPNAYAWCSLNTSRQSLPAVKLLSESTLAPTFQVLFKG